MLKNTLAIISTMLCLTVRAQFVVSTGTTVGVGNSPNIVIQSIGDVNFGSSSINLGSSNLDIQLLANSGTGFALNTSNPITVNSVTLNNTAPYSLTGSWTISSDIQFKNGLLSVSSPNTLLYKGPDLAISNPNLSGTSYVQGPLSIQIASKGALTYPIGDADGFFPAKLGNVTDASTVLSIECVKGDPAIAPDSLSADINGVFTDHYWQMAVVSGTFSGSPIALSLTGADTFLNSETAVVIEKVTGANYINDLLGSSANSFVISKDNISAEGGIYAIASSKDVVVKIHKIITPNGDSQNETLVIEGLDYYTDNKVILLDRWGAIYFEKSGFKNYTSNVPQQTDFDYSKLNSGNYICTVQFIDTTGKTHKVKPQMISVLK
jgi:hypothetical protein